MSKLTNKVVSGLLVVDVFALGDMALFRVLGVYSFSASLWIILILLEVFGLNSLAYQKV
jgi:hypothetical protein